MRYCLYWITTFGLLLRLSNITTLDISSLFVLLWNIVLSYCVVRRQSSAFVDRSLASLHWCDRLRGRVPTFDVEQPLRVNVSYCSRRRLLAVTFDVCCILSTVFDGHTEELFLLAGLA